MSPFCLIPCKHPIPSTFPSHASPLLLCKPHLLHTPSLSTFRHCAHSLTLHPPPSLSGVPLLCPSAFRFIYNNLVVEITSTKKAAKILAWLLKRHMLVSYFLYCAGKGQVWAPLYCAGVGRCGVFPPSVCMATVTQGTSLCQALCTVQVRAGMGSDQRFCP